MWLETQNIKVKKLVKARYICLVSGETEEDDNKEKSLFNLKPNLTNRRLLETFEESLLREG